MKQINCQICKIECPCSCYQFDADESGTIYFCSAICINDFENKYNCDVEFSHLSECEKLGYLAEEWVKELQKRYIIYKDLAEDRHRKWIKLKTKADSSFKKVDV